MPQPVVSKPKRVRKTEDWYCINSVVPSNMSYMQQIAFAIHQSEKDAARVSGQQQLSAMADPLATA